MEKFRVKYKHKGFKTTCVTDIIASNSEEAEDFFKSAMKKNGAYRQTFEVISVTSEGIVGGHEVMLASGSTLVL